MNVPGLSESEIETKLNSIERQRSYLINSKNNFNENVQKFYSDQIAKSLMHQNLTPLEVK